MKSIFQKTAILCIIINILSTIVILITKNHLPPIVPLFYGLPVSESELAPNIALVVPPVIAGGFAGLNLVLNSLFKDKFLEQIFGGLMIATTALSTITLIKIILLVGTF